MIETIINSCLHHQCLLRVIYTHPLAKTQTFIGYISDNHSKTDKIRLHLYDGKNRVFLYDDLGKKNQVTLQKKHIKTIVPLFNIYYPTKQRGLTLDHQTRLFNAYQAIRKPMITEVGNVDAYLFKSYFLHENIVSIKQKSRYIPVVSYQLIYNLDTNCYDKTVYIHHEQQLHLFLHTVPKLYPIDTLTKRVKAFIKSNFDVEEGAFVFTMKPQFKFVPKSMINKAMHHPYKALHHKLTPKNLGRKTYIVPPFIRKGDPLLYQTVVSSLTHPVTLSYLSEDFKHIVNSYQKSALLNDKNALIIASSEAVKTLAPQPMVLPLINHNILDESIDAFLELDQKTETSQSLPRVAYNDFFKMIEIMSQRAQNHYQLMYLQNIFDKNIMNEFSIRLDSVIYQEHLKRSCDIQFLYKHNAYSDIYHQAYHDYQANRRAKITLPLYKEIHDVFMMKDRDKRRKEVLKWTQKPGLLRRLKHLFPVIITSDNRTVYPHHMTFDMLVAYNHKNLSYFQLGLSKKITWIQSTYPYSEYVENNAMVNNQYTVFDQFNASKKDTIKRINMPNPLINRHPIIHDILAKKVSTHTVYNHVSVARALIHKTIDPWAIRTPFHAQRTLLKNSLDVKDIDTFYTLTNSRMLLSLPVDKTMSDKTYDWIKNHPYLEKTLNHSPLDIMVDVEAVYHLTSHEDKLAEALDYFNNLQVQPKHITIAEALNQILTTYINNPNTKLKEDVPLTNIFPELSMPIIKRLPYVFYQPQVTLVCVELPNNLTQRQYERLMQVCRYNHITLITYYKVHALYLKQLITILQTIDLIKAR